MASPSTMYFLVVSATAKRPLSLGNIISFSPSESSYMPLFGFSLKIMDTLFTVNEDSLSITERLP
jgi:hypothetical protein